jgi:hypothetical protein
MSKPIFILRFPHSNEDRSKYLELLEMVRKTLRDYHVLGFMDSNTGKIEFECYNADNVAEVDIQEIKQRIEESKL